MIRYATISVFGMLILGALPVAQAADEAVAPADTSLSVCKEVRYQPLSPTSAIWAGSTFWTGPDWTRVGKDWHHPGQDTPSVRRLTVPKQGQVVISGRVWKVDTNGGGGDGVRLMIRHNDREVWKAEIEGNDTQGVEPNLTLDVQQGDVLRFVVDKRGDIGYDTTHWDPVVTYTEGLRLQASADFLTELSCGQTNQDKEKQDLSSGTNSSTQNLWAYEMDAVEMVRQKEAELRGLEVLKTVLASDVVYQLERAPGQNDPAFTKEPDMTLWGMVQGEWCREDQLRETAENYRTATANHLERTGHLLADLRQNNATSDSFLQAEAEQLQRWSKDFNDADAADLTTQRQLYYQVRWLKRHVALSNPLMNFGKMLFTKRVPSSYSHLVMQYFGWRARPGGGIFVLERPGYSLECRDILEGQLAGGNVLEPRLSYDAKRIVFSYVPHADKNYDPQSVRNDDKDEGFYHIFEVGVDGTGLRQITAGTYDDLMPTYLPDGGIAFCSTRRRGYARCFGPQFSERWHIYTLHRVDPDGTNLKKLSVHDTNEWFPTVDHNGRLLYSRWDYIDRDAVTHQNLWATRPDGTNPIAVWGNGAPSPHCTFQPQPIPESQKIIFTASAHHSITGGSIVILDPTVDNNSPDALQRITPEVPFPEAETYDIKEYYASPWPLSEKYFLTAYSPFPLIWEPSPNTANALGIYLLDAFGNRELIYRDPAIGSTNPCPLRARPCPPILTSVLPEEASPMGEVVLTDVYEGLGNVPRGTIKQLRIVQIFPKTTPVGDNPPIGIASEENGRAILGTVPVEADGSARFHVPAMTPILFQALDENGFAYQTMRTLTYVQPGEQLSCIGCHERRQNTPVSKNLIALRQPPVAIEPGPFGGEPFSYVRVVQPVLDRHCVGCHSGEKPDGEFDLSGTVNGFFTRSYISLCGNAEDFFGTALNEQNASRALVPRFGRRNQIQITPPGGMYGARGSRLIRLIQEGHYDVQLSPEELQRLGTWIDMNAIFYGVNNPEDQARQLRGEKLPMPEIQ